MRPKRDAAKPPLIRVGDAKKANFPNLEYARADKPTHRASRPAQGTHISKRRDLHHGTFHRFSS